MNAIQKFQRFLSGKKIRQEKGKNARYVDTVIKSVSKKEEGDILRVNFFLENGAIFQKKFKFHEFEKMKNKNSGDEVTLVIYPDGIIRDIY